jgi:hypothetical protein
MKGMLLGNQVDRWWLDPCCTVLRARWYRMVSGWLAFSGAAALLSVMVGETERDTIILEGSRRDVVCASPGSVGVNPKIMQELLGYVTNRSEGPGAS